MPDVVHAFEPDEEVARTLGLDGGGGGRRWPWILGGLVLLVGIAVAVGVALTPPLSDRWETAPAEIGSLDVLVTAVGTVQPRNQVDISFELSGIVDEVLVEANDRVTEGDPLARLDASVLQAQLSQADANVSAMRAALRQASVGVDNARDDRDRLQTLATSGSVAKADLARAERAWRQAVAALGVAEGNLAAASAARTVAATNVDKAVLTAPIDGVVLDRQVEPGQAVVSSLQAQRMFTVAEDLSHMEVRVEVDEADISRVASEQRATFTVAAWPDRVFEAVVDLVKLSPTPTQQVVTYEATLLADNDDGALVPGMTATAEILAGRHTDALLVPSGALRFRPSDVEDLASPAPGRGRVWTVSGEDAVPVDVTLGPGDGRHTIVTSGLEAGTPVIVREVPKAERRQR